MTARRRSPSTTRTLPASRCPGRSQPRSSRRLPSASARRAWWPGRPSLRSCSAGFHGSLRVKTSITTRPYLLFPRVFWQLPGPHVEVVVQVPQRLHYLFCPRTPRVRHAGRKRKAEAPQGAVVRVAGAHNARRTRRCFRGRGEPATEFRLLEESAESSNATRMAGALKPGGRGAFQARRTRSFNSTATLRAVDSMTSGAPRAGRPFLGKNLFDRASF